MMLMHLMRVTFSMLLMLRNGAVLRKFQVRVGIFNRKAGCSCKFYGVETLVFDTFKHKHEAVNSIFKSEVLITIKVIAK